MAKSKQNGSESRNSVTLTEVHKKQVKELLDQANMAKLQLADKFLEMLGISTAVATAMESYRKKVLDIARLYGIDPEDKDMSWDFNAEKLLFERSKNKPVEQSKAA